MLDKLIRELKENGIISAAPLGFKGKALPVLSFLGLMVDTDSYTPDKEQIKYLTDRMIRDGGSVK